MKKSLLTVQPVKRYKQPHYPGWQDPNPLEHPDAVPLPFSIKVLRMLAAAGFAGATFSGCLNEPCRNENDPIWTPADSLRNTFTFEKNGLPYQSPSFGTGAPLPLNRRFALSVLENLAQKEGFDMQKGHVFESEGVKITLDGWDENRRTGFVFVDYGNSEDGISGWDIRMPIAQIEVRDTAGVMRERKTFGSWSEAWEFYNGHFPEQKFDRSNFMGRSEAEDREAERLLALEFPNFEERSRRKLAFLKARFPIELISFDWDEKNSTAIERHAFPKLEKCLKDLSESLNPQKQLDFYEDYENTQPFISYTYSLKNMEKHWISVFSMPKISQRREKLRQWRRLIVLAYRNEMIRKKFEKALAHPQADPLEVLSAELETFDRQTISLAELRALDKLAASGEAFVMPISEKDERLSYYQWNMPKTWGGPFSNKSDPPPTLLESLENRQEEMAEHYRKKPGVWYEKDVLDALSEMEQQARFYLRWAKWQGF